MPDFVAVVGAEAALDRRRASGMPPVMNEADARLLANLHAGRPLRLSTIAGSMGWKPDEVAARMERLAASGAVVRATGDRYTR